ncbi:hypothetical protein L873DRAFT_1817832 [Choiromyces venosus 120613-1]|uniref:Uncharacterized protein n=1 Tax=Choiromyces venosus 120613-1 TaxID=1336337 RepID=A0A3N4J1Z7_9PEZI|nr:hypothetical protein L873DRAFT_1817832 [Choiromyces venosus 120613-1]
MALHQSSSASLNPSLGRSLQVPVHLRTPTPLPLILAKPRPLLTSVVQHLVT